MMLLALAVAQLFAGCACMCMVVGGSGVVVGHHHTQSVTQSRESSLASSLQRERERDFNFFGWCNPQLCAWMDGKGSGLSKEFLGALLSDLVVLPDNPPSPALSVGSIGRSQRLLSTFSAPHPSSLPTCKLHHGRRARYQPTRAMHVQPSYSQMHGYIQISSARTGLTTSLSSLSLYISQGLCCQFPGYYQLNCYLSHYYVDLSSGDYYYNVKEDSDPIYIQFPIFQN